MWQATYTFASRLRSIPSTNRLSLRDRFRQKHTNQEKVNAQGSRSAIRDLAQWSGKPKPSGATGQDESSIRLQKARRNLSAAVLINITITSQNYNVKIHGQDLLNEVNGSTTDTPALIALERLIARTEDTGLPNEPRGIETKDVRPESPKIETGVDSVIILTRKIIWLYRLRSDVQIEYCCKICFEDVRVDHDLEHELDVSRMTFRCSHLFDICKSCASTSIASQLNSTFVDQLKCPICPQSLEYEDVKKHATHVDFER
ncbi:MAG: hypothetical protein M1828_002158 [Chrysothrix sp. TS-e1954]|nr:MAG: hypothetical protein M1828_002158 [Chrysothrix sp. TS-e1954]